MRIGIDARFYGPAGKGLGRYVQKLIANLEKIDSLNEYFIFLRPENFRQYQPQSGNFQKIPVDCGWYTLAEQIKIPLVFAKYNLDLVHFPHFNAPLFYRRKFVVTIHDLILLHFPTRTGSFLNPLLYEVKYLGYQWVIKSALKRAQKIITVSRFTRDDILKNYSLAPEKILVTYEAAETAEKTRRFESKTMLEKYGIIKPYLLYVGNAYPHKNLETLILAFKEISRRFEKINLVLVGKEDRFYLRLKDFIKKQKINKVIFPGFVSDEDLSVVYKEAEVFVFPSLYEGFGLPPLEAMAQETPVASSDHPCMREILGQAAIFFNPRDKNSLIEAVAEVLQNQNLRLKLKKLGREQTLKYSWEEMARRTLEIYNNCLS